MSDGCSNCEADDIYATLPNYLAPLGEDLTLCEPCYFDVLDELPDDHPLVEAANDLRDSTDTAQERTE